MDTILAILFVLAVLIICWRLYQRSRAKSFDDGYKTGLIIGRGRRRH